VELYSVDKLMAQTRKLAADYRRATGQPLPVSAEIANYDAARLLDLEIIQPPPGGYDAVGLSGQWQDKKVQIKGRAIFDEKKPGQRIGQLKVEQPWDTVVLVIMDDNYEPVEIYAADREEILESLDDQGNRSKRGAMSVAKFKIISNLVWTRDEGLLDGEIWDNSQNI
jgi:hypothetical protein